MMSIPPRFLAALIAAGVHLMCSVAVAAVAAGLVFGLWYPYPYQALSGGRDLFFLVVVVDVICGPLLTCVLYNPAKPRTELWRDLALVIVVQLLALGYGLWTVWQARPLYLVHEVDRFKVVALPNLSEDAVNALVDSLKPRLLGGPITVAIRKPKSVEEKNAVLFGVLEGGRDYADRPEFYVPYEGDVQRGVLQRAKPLSPFLRTYPDQLEDAKKLAAEVGKPLEQLVYLPVRARQDWIAILDDKAVIVGFLRGDGF
jgi:hypothetical protein